MSVDTDTKPVEGESAEDKKKRERDFSKYTDKHEDLADFVNADPDFLKAELPNVTPNQVKAILALRTDWANSPEQAEERAKRKAEREAREAKYEGLTDEQKKAQKAADAALEQAERLEARVKAAREKAAKFESAVSGSGEDLAAAVAEAEKNTRKAPAKKKPTVSK